MTRKKKIRQSKHQEEPGKEAETSDENSPSQLSHNGCPHITKSLNGSNLKKVLKSNAIKIGVCQGCSGDRPNKSPSSTDNQPDKNETTNSEAADEEKSFWLCLQCGYHGCGRTSSSKHSLLHHQTSHSDPHDIVVNPETWAVWCYKCDDEVGGQATRRLAECLEMLKKNFAQTTSKCSQTPSKQASPVSKVNLEVSPAAKEVSKTVDEVQKASPKKPINGLRTDTPNVLRVKGLSNLGNTCFFNAVLQSLSQCRCFVGALREHCATGSKWHIDLSPEQRIQEVESVDVTLNACGVLTDALLKFLDEMDHTSQKNGVITPINLFKRVCEKASQFRSFKQQDSHELLRYLLDAVRNEEIKRQRLGILSTFGIERTSQKEVDEKTRSALKALSAVTDFTIVEQVFGGQLVSTVQCEECHVSSQVFEPFMDLCLPIFEEKPSRPGLHKGSNSSDKVVAAHESVSGVAYRKGENPRSSRHQEKKLKRQQKKDAKKQVKQQKHLATVIPLQKEEGISQEVVETTEGVNEEKETEEKQVTQVQAAEENEEEEEEDEEGEETAEEKDDQGISADQSGDSVSSNFPDMEVYITEADVEDNDETSSHHSQGSSKSQNESDLSSLSPSETVCASGSTTVESDLTTTENIDDNSAPALEIGYHCQQVASLDLNHHSPSKDSFVDSSTAASGLTSPNSIEITSTDSGIVGCSTDSGVFQALCKSSSASQTSTTQKCTQKMLATSLMPLAQPCKLASQECSVLSSLHQFTMKELLMGNNKFGCENCTKRKADKNGLKPDEKHPVVYTNASKQLLISSPPAVLTLQLKRFQQVGRNLMKVNRYVEFPILLDLAPFCSRLALALPHLHSGQHQIIYSLVGVVEHSGKLTGGHYTAFVKVQPVQQHPTKFPFLNHKTMGEKELQFLMEEVDKKHDSDCSWELFSDLGEEVKNLFDKTKTFEVPSGKWFHVSDSHLTEVSESTVLRCKAYLLFYERIV